MEQTEDAVMNDVEPQPVEAPQRAGKRPPVERPIKKEGPLAPRLAAKLKDLESRGLLTGAKAHVCPQDAARLAKADSA